MGAGEGVNQLCSDPHPIPALADRAFEHITDAKLAPNLLHVDGLVLLRLFPQLIVREPEQAARLEMGIIAGIDPEETAEWQRAAAAAKAEATFFIAQPHHCDIGTKPA